MVVLMQEPRAVATRSVGENSSPLPLLSVGASVAIFDCEGPWTASQWSSPVYLIEILTITKCNACLWLAKSKQSIAAKESHSPEPHPCAARTHREIRE